MIRLENISVEYRLKSERVQALRDVDLHVRDGNFEAIMGPSGSGKTTLIQLIAGLLTPTAGEVIVSGEHLSAMDDEKISAFRNRTIGFVFQFFNLPSYYNAVDNAALPLVFAGVDERHRRRARPARCWRNLGWGSGSTTSPISFRAAKRNAWPSPAR